MTPADRPAEPAPGQYVWYRGWECGFHDDAEFWTGHGWQAYKGGADIGAPNVSGLTFAELLDEIEDDEEGAAIIRTHGQGVDRRKRSSTLLDFTRESVRST